MRLSQKIQMIVRLALLSGIAGAAPASMAQTIQTLYSTPTGALRDTYTGDVGSQFQVGSTNVIVSHLGVFNQNSNGLTVSHITGVFSSTHVLLAQLNFSAGNAEVFSNGFQWMPLDPPLLLASNATYFLMGSVANADGDGWQDAFAPTWNTVFIGSTATTTRHATYGPGVAGWPPGSFTPNGNNNTYGNVSLANIPIDQARVGVQSTSVAASAGQALTVTGFASGQLPISYQWYRGSISSPINGQTNAQLVIPNAAVTNSGTYFLVATNALGGEQSSNVTVSVTAVPVSITQQPTNVTVFQNYTASFSISTAGTQPISYQWFRNGNPISGATSSNYSLVANFTNNADVYFCQASNNISSVANVTNSSNATLTVIYNLAQPQEFLHGARANTATNNFAGGVGGQFMVGNAPVLVTHLGYYASQFTDTNKTNAVLTLNHPVAIFSSNASVLYGSVVVPAGTNSVINGYMWVALNPPLMLSANTQYLLMAEVFSGSPTPDPWGDAYSIPDLNPYFATACDANYWGAWPPTGISGSFSGQMYSAPNLAVLALPTPSVFVAPAAVSNYAGLSADFTATVAGQAPLTVQWYEEPGILLGGDTNLDLNFSSLVASNAGSYYAIVTNKTTSAGAQSADAVLTVLPDVGPSITQDVQSQTADLYQTVQFSVTAGGTPTLLYQWTFNGNPIPGATGSTLTLTDVSTASTGNYQLLVTNNFGNTNSAVASLSVTVPTFGSYASAVMGPSLLLYYPFNDVNSGLGIATNLGSLGFGYDGIYDGIYSGVPGPFSNVDSNNMAVNLDGLTADVSVPQLTNVVVTNCTIAAWVNDVNNPQSPSGGNEAIFFQRNGSILGLSVNPLVAGAGDQLRATWAGTVHDSGFVLPTNQWAFVAMVVSPTNIAVWMQNGSGMQTTNFSGAFSPATFTGNSYVGWDTAGGSAGRRWTGPIDEVMVFNQALSATAINALYLGVPASATLTITPAGGKVVITWPGGTLQQATNVAGPWTATVGATNGVYTVTPSGTVFYRVQLQ